MHKWRGLSLGVALAGCGAVWAAEAPVAVSPGSVDGIAQVESRCPGFDWGSGAGAHSYEVVVYRIGELEEEAEPVLRQTVPGNAHGWTPSLDRCLERGGRYAWIVRALGPDGESAWSRPSLFEVAPGPSEQEIAEALRVVQEHLSTRGETVVPRALPQIFYGQPTSSADAAGPLPQAHAGGGIVVNDATVLNGWQRSVFTLQDQLLGPGNALTLVGNCPSGKVVIGGGGHSSNFTLNLFTSSPASNTEWRVGWSNTGSTAAATDLESFIICVHL